jgi:hypothetical protein
MLRLSFAGVLLIGLALLGCGKEEQLKEVKTNRNMKTIQKLKPSDVRELKAKKPPPQAQQQPPQ